MSGSGLKDRLGNEVYEGDYLLDERGIGVVVLPTEHSFIAQTILRIARVNFTRTRGLRAEGSHRYIQPQFCVVVDPGDIRSKKENEARFKWSVQQHPFVRNYQRSPVG